MHYLVALVALSAVAIRLGARPPAVILLLLSSPVFWLLHQGQLEWLVLLALLLPPRWGVFLAIIKSQVGLGLLIFWFVEAWRVRQLWGVLSRFGPLAVAMLASFALFGFWPERARFLAGDQVGWNDNIWPACLLIGVPLIVTSVLFRKLKLALAAGPYLSPYAFAGSYVGVIMACVKSPSLMVFVVVSFWAYHLYFRNVVMRLLGY